MADEPSNVPAQPYWKTAPFAITVVFAPLVYIVICAVLFLPVFSNDLKTFVVTQAITLVLGGAMGFFLGASLQQQNAAKPKGPTNETP